MVYSRDGGFEWMCVTRTHRTRISCIFSSFHTSCTFRSSMFWREVVCTGFLWVCYVCEELCTWKWTSMIFSENSHSHQPLPLLNEKRTVRTQLRLKIPLYKQISNKWLNSYQQIIVRIFSPKRKHINTSYTWRLLICTKLYCFHTKYIQYIEWNWHAKLTRTAPPFRWWSSTIS